jgi:hypothetical protein
VELAVSTLADLWDNFCTDHAISASSVPLFAADEAGNVEVFKYGRGNRPMLRRSPAMRAKLIDTVRSVLSVSKSEGVLYMMHRFQQNQHVVPLYIGKAARHGRFGAAMSANLENIQRNESKFARWGYNYAYHLGDLSAAVLKWAKTLFDCTPSPAPRPRFDVRFWCTAWGPESVGIWREFSPCPLAFAEYLLIVLPGFYSLTISSMKRGSIESSLRIESAPPLLLARR